MKNQFTAEEIGSLDNDRLKRLCLLLAEGRKVAELATQFNITSKRTHSLIAEARKKIESWRRVREAVAAGKVLEITVADILPRLWANALDNAYLTTVGAVAQKSEAELLKYRGFGKKALRLLEERLAEFNIRLPGTKLREAEWFPLRESLRKAGYTDGAVSFFREMLNALGHDIRICRRG